MVIWNWKRKLYLLRLWPFRTTSSKYWKLFTCTHHIPWWVFHDFQILWFKATWAVITWACFKANPGVIVSIMPGTQIVYRDDFVKYRDLCCRYNFTSWRDFSYLDEEDKEKAEKYIFSLWCSMWYLKMLYQNNSHWIFVEILHSLWKCILTLFGLGYLGVGKDGGGGGDSAPPTVIFHEVVMVSPWNFQNIISSLFQTGNNHFHPQIL